MMPARYCCFCAALPAIFSAPPASTTVGQERLHHQPLAELLQHDHRLDRAATEAAVGLRKRHAQPAELRKRPPVLGRVAELLLDRLLPLLERVIVLNESRDAVLQQRLFVGQ
jgi:hypothetical protein